MSQLTQAAEARKIELIDKLMFMGAFQEGDKHPLELSLRELENKYRRVKSKSHPHSQLGSIRLVGKKVKVQ